MPLRVSVIICTKTGKRIIDKTVKSVAPSADEVIIMKDKWGNLNKVRNAGAFGSTGDIIAYIDDDCVASRNWIKNGIKHFKEDRNLMALGGKVTGTLRTTKKRKFFGCNMMIREEVFFEYLLSFPQDFESGRGDETAFLWEMLNCGLKVKCFDDVVVKHVLKPGSKVSEKNQELLCKYYPERYRLLKEKDIVI